MSDTTSMIPAMSSVIRNDEVADTFLPDLCNVQALLFMVIGAGTCALMFTLVRSGLAQFDWTYFALTSLFMLWTILSSAVILCRLRRRIASWPAAQQAGLAFSVVLGATAVYAMLVQLVVPPGNVFQWTPWFLLESVTISAILTGLLLRYFYLQHQWHVQQKSELGARVQALQARIRPHFLFNSLNSIAGLIPENPDAAENALLDLSELFRAALRESRHLVNVKEELQLCKRYLSIEKLRLGPRLEVAWRLQHTSAQALLPPLCLQPLIENAVYHGIQPSPSGGVVEVEAYEQGRWLYILVKNPLLSVEKSNSVAAGNQVAMANIRSRLAAFFGSDAVLKSSQHEQKYVVTLRVPLSQQPTASR